MFLLKKIIAPFFLPLPLCLALLAVGLVLLWFSRRHRAGKILVSVGTMLLLICSYTFIPALALRPLEQKYPPAPETTGAIKYVVVLGGGHSSDPTLPVTSKLGPESLYRLLEGVRLYQARPGRKLILSGGGVIGAVPESQTLSGVAFIIGVKPKDIIQESACRDTEEHARLIKFLVGREKFFLVTSPPKWTGPWACSAG